MTRLFLRVRLWFRNLWRLALARSRVVLGSLLAFLAQVVPIVADQLPGVVQFVDSLPITAAARANLQTGLTLLGAVVALYGRVDMLVKRSKATDRLAP